MCFYINIYVKTHYSHLIHINAEPDRRTREEESKEKERGKDTKKLYGKMIKDKTGQPAATSVED